MPRMPGHQQALGRRLERKLEDDEPERRCHRADDAFRRGGHPGRTRCRHQCRAASAWALSAVLLPLGLRLGLAFPVLGVVSQRVAPLRQTGLVAAMAGVFTAAALAALPACAAARGLPLRLTPAAATRTAPA